MRNASWKVIKEAVEAVNTAPSIPFEEKMTCDIVEEFESMKERIRLLEHRVQQFEMEQEFSTPRKLYDAVEYTKAG